MRMTKKPMMAKRATKAAPAKKTMAAKKKTMAAKKPMTVAGKTVKKYQVGGPAMGTMPKGMAGTLGSPRAKPTTTVTPAKTPPKTVGMQRPTIAPGMTAAQMRQAYGQSMGLNKAEAQRRNAGMATDFGGALGGAQPGRFTNYGPGSGQFQQEAPPAYQYNPQTSGRSDPRAIAARQEQERQRIMQEQMMQGGGLGGGMPFGQQQTLQQQMLQQGLIANNGGAGQGGLYGGMPPNQRPPAQVIGGPRPPMPPKQGLIANNGGAGQGGLFGQPMGTSVGGRYPVERESVSPQELQARKDAMRQQLMQQGMTPQQIQNELARTTHVMSPQMVQAGQGGLFSQPMGTQDMYRPQIGTAEQERARMQQMMAGNSTRQMTPQQIRAQQEAFRLSMGVPSQQQMGVQGLAPGTPAPRQAVRESPEVEARKAASLQGLGARQFRKGGAVAKKKKPAATTRGRMAKPARKR